MMQRPDLANIKQWIKPGSRVLDLGCGDGTLLSMLRDEMGVDGYGLEIEPENIIQCVRKGINVIQRDLDAGLSDFDEQTFDYVIMTQTLQAVHFPDRLLTEMLRVGHQGIVTFPNFGNWKNRLQLGIGGRMPVSKTLPAQWYDTLNIHLCTVKDFEDLCHQHDIRILERMVVDQAHRARTGIRFLPNLLGEIALFRCQRGSV
ncbi:MAG: methionine biosynthesis protein MetW [Gammaproteobacteria bacterium]|nr:methionine biosynthesis protein MetW [Gammaproteobacteria bacterium]